MLWVRANFTAYGSASIATHAYPQINRPFSWINSRIFCAANSNGRVRGKYNARKRRGRPESHSGRSPAGVASLAPKIPPIQIVRSMVAPETANCAHNTLTMHATSCSEDVNHFKQFANIDMGFWAWDFFLQDENNVNIGSIRRNFSGFAREIFTDTGAHSEDKPKLGLMRNARSICDPLLSRLRCSE